MAALYGWSGTSAMSSTARGTVRENLDQYFTPRWCLHRLLEARALPGGLWLEPCAGVGMLIRSANEVRKDITWAANELDETYLTGLRALPNVAMVTNFDARYLQVGAGFSVVISNPPFGCSQEILERCLMIPGALTIFLQRLNWCAGPRRELFRKIKPSVYVLPDRPSFRENVKIDANGKERKTSTDSIEYSWFVFDGLGRFEVLGDTHEDVRRAEKEERRQKGNLLVDSVSKSELETHPHTQTLHAEVDDLENSPATSFTTS
jgi:hypothetical protein